MPKRTDLKKIMIIGSGPIIIGQAAEFDFSGSQACRSLKEEGYSVVLANSNPATIQTDLEIADRTYIEPLTVEIVEKIIAAERPQGILSGMGGQTALNLCSELAEKGILEKYGVELLGTPVQAIADSEDRDLFRETMLSINEPIPKSFACNSLAEVKAAVTKIGGLPVIIRPAYTFGGSGSGIAHNNEELLEIVERGLLYSRIKQVLVEECVSGWMEFEYEVMRDKNNNCIIICNMENLDPMGIHTGESIVIAPAQTLSDRDHQLLRNASLKIIRALNIQGGCNVQFAVNPATGPSDSESKLSSGRTCDYRVIEVNPRVSRSSALASKATGYPIARVAAKIAVGMTLDEIPNSITGKTYASFEPALDYVVLKIPRWPFDKFRTVDKRIGTQMKSTGEVMAIGRTVEEALFKAIRSLETDRIAFELTPGSLKALVSELVEPTDNRLYAIAEALRQGYNITTICDLTKWTKFFIDKIWNIIQSEKVIQSARKEDEAKTIAALDRETLNAAKRLGFSDEYIAYLLGIDNELPVRARRKEFGILPDYKMVDTCAAEFDAATPYFYSTYENDIAKYEMRNANLSGANSPIRNPQSAMSKVLVLGSGPIRIGQGIEFDYCSVHAVMAAREQGLEAIIINNNPETVSTDYDISDRLYFEPLAFEDVVNIIDHERPDGVILQFGGQTSVNLAIPLQAELDRRPDLPTKILGTQAKQIDIAENREKFEELLNRLNIYRPPAGTGYSFEQVREIASGIGYPVLVRPSYVLGGRGMEIVHNEKELEFYMTGAVKASKQHPVLVDKYLTNAIEIDVDAVCDGTDVFIGGIMEHIEEAGVHSGDAICVLPPQTLPERIIKQIREITRELALNLKVVGLTNIQFAIKDDTVYILEANPRASRTVPYVSKAINIPLAKLATRVMITPLLPPDKQFSLKELLTLINQGIRSGGTKIFMENGCYGINIKHTAIKAPVFPFQKLPGVDYILGPEMKSTGEVMGIDKTFDDAYYKSFLAAGNSLPMTGSVYITVRDGDKDKIIPIARKLKQIGLDIMATAGTAQFLKNYHIDVETIWRISERKTPNALSLMREGKVKLIINTPTEGSGPQRDGYRMRRLAVEMGIPFITNIAAARAAVNAIQTMSGQNKALAVKAMQDYF
ncbi:MAG: carbamoyl-phosphate synthase large subunit [Planctomycetes bacterium]|nr:carbamoyl-phosphate synthase large subunit [Planctomycetota bacterium]